MDQDIPIDDNQIIEEYVSLNTTDRSGRSHQFQPNIDVVSFLDKTGHCVSFQTVSALITIYDAAQKTAKGEGELR